MEKLHPLVGPQETGNVSDWTPFELILKHCVLAITCFSDQSLWNIWMCSFKIYCSKQVSKHRYCIVENFRGGKLPRISQFCGCTRKFSPQNLGHGVLWRGKSEQSVKVFSAKIVFSPICETFLLRMFTAIWYTLQCSLTSLGFRLATISKHYHDNMPIIIELQWYKFWLS